MSICYRRGTLQDSQNTFEVFRESIMDLGDRLGVMPISGGQDPQVVQNLWSHRQPLFDHLARTSDNFWVAEENGRLIGFARSILRQDVRQLTEFFVLPQYQSSGVGRELLGRAFPVAGAGRRFILATIDGRAVQRYLKAKVYPLFPCCTFSHAAPRLDLATDLTIEPITPSAQALGELNRIDRAVLGFARVAEHAWLIESRQGYFYRRRGAVVGYGYLGQQNGPFALLDPQDFPPVLAHAEGQAAGRGSDFSVEVPMVNRAAVDHLLGRGCRLESFFEFFMADAPFGKFENYVLTSPPFFV
ncbi:MAG TPA: GNAT family N-acetyltransferase [Anaerolineales bacterium]|nr:GNAT family N-acetyltransferase [Anaerolineales bacterium]